MKDTTLKYANIATCVILIGAFCALAYSSYCQYQSNQEQAIKDTNEHLIKTALTLDQKTAWFQETPAEDLSSIKGKTGTITSIAAVAATSEEHFQSYVQGEDVFSMLEKGQMVCLLKGTKVTCIEYNFPLLKFRAPDGQILYITKRYVSIEGIDE